MPSPSYDSIVGAFAIRLAQKRFSGGRFYVAQILQEGIIAALDCRFYIEEGSSLVPTRKGFRIHHGEFPYFEAILRQPANRLVEQVIWKTSKRALTCRYCDDKYGQGVDFRYFIESENYTGAEKRGLRLATQDFRQISVAILSECLLQRVLKESENIFQGKIIQRGNWNTSGPSRMICQNLVSTDADEFVNPGILQLLAEM
jgi:hypothetical protein